MVRSGGETWGKLAVPMVGGGGGGGVGGTWGKLAVPMVGGGGGVGGTWGKFTREVPHPWGKVHSDLVKSPPMPHPAPGGGGGGGGGGIIDRCMHMATERVP